MSGPPLLPQWIDWAHPPSYSTGYRKLTNLYGGLPSDPNLKWMSHWNYSNTNQDQPEYIPVYESDPQYLWFLDQNSQKLKVSEADSPITYTLNPVQNCLESKTADDCSSDCCSTSSSLDKCMYGWNWGYGKNYGYFSFPKSSTCDRWSYLATPPPQSTGQDISGTFCLNGRNTDHYMRTYLGCDGVIATNASHTDCVNIGTKGCTDSMTDDVYISSNPDPSGTRAEWQFIDEDIAFSCCTLDANTNPSQFTQCSYAFNPRATVNKCAPIIQDYCAKHWNDSSIISDKCQQFLATSPSSCTTIQQTIQNYITNPTRSPQDYISKPLASVGNQTSVDYYRQYNCNIGQTCSPNENPACCRDDSTDPFFVYDIPYLCNSGNKSCPISTLQDPTTGDTLGVCDAQLQYLCQSYTRDELAKDPTLQHMCGCFLSVDPNTPPTNPNILSAPQMHLTTEGSTPANPSPYYTISNDATGYSCDDLCNSADVQSKMFGGKCTQNVCIIDNVNVTYVNSDTGDQYIEQNCGSDSTCYIQNISLTSINSSTGGAHIDQECGSCYTFDDDIQTATPVDCSTLQPYGPSPPPDNGGGGTGGSSTDHRKFLLIIIIVLLIGAALFFIYSYFKNKSQRRMMGSGLYDDGGVYFDPGYWDGY
jgi:hypothetical protein